MREKQKNNISVRRIFNSVAAIILIIAMISMTACSAEQTPAVTNPTVPETLVIETKLVSDWLPAQWDAEADIVVVGFGGAGASAALEAVREGASVIVLEKSPEALFGGNTSVCVGGLLSVTDPVSAKVFLRQQAGASVSDAELDAWIEENMDMGTLLESLIPDAALNHIPAGVSSGLYRHHELSKSIDGLYTLGVGANLFKSFKNTLEAEGGDLVTIMPETPATHLIFNPVTKEVLGVYAESGGKQIAVKAKKAVIMACGGYEANEEMLANFVEPGQNKIWPWGSPYNTGDGIKMVTEVGAALRHLNGIEWGAPAVRLASEDAGVGVCIGSTVLPYEHSIVVNKYGKRFYNELNLGGNSPLPNHSKENIPMLDYDIKNFEYPNLPFYMVFDETRRLEGPIAEKARETNPTETWTAMKGVLLWSEDNQREIEKGYILKADTLEELAELAGIDPEGLVANVKAWNAACKAGVDSEFGREKQLTPIETGPFYITELAMATINTQGGAVRNEKHQVVSWEGTPIPRLYAAGEFGSIFGHLYSGGLNAPEAITGGKFAAKNALSLETEWK